MSPPPTLSATDYAVLGLLSEGPSHGFAISKQLDPDTEVGRVLTVRRPLVYRSLDRLVDAGYAEPVSTERGEGPNRVILRTTARGRARLRRWLAEPVEHVRELRIEFLLKLALVRRSGDSPIQLIRAQQRALDPTLEALDEQVTGDEDHVELWRRHNALAAGAYLEALERIHGTA
jgi:DNA-binding PadR family transcriptional regulator